MFFLVPYHLIDREDLSVIQKMCILYLARHYDEKGAAIPINELELAEKLRISTSEVRLNLEVLLSKGIIDIDNKTMPENNEEDGKDIIVKDAVFKDFNLDSFEELKNKLNNRTYREDRDHTSTMEEDFLKDLTELDAFKDETLNPKPDNDLEAEEEKNKDLDKENSTSKAFESFEDFKEFEEQMDSKEEGDGEEEDYEEFLKNISRAEERIKERASKLKLNVRRENRREKYNKNNQNAATPQYNRRKSDRKNLNPSEKDMEADELLNILAKSNKNLLDEKKTLVDQGLERRSALTKKKPDSEEARKKVNPKFMRASSVYKQNEIRKGKKDSEENGNIEV